MQMRGWCLSRRCWAQIWLIFYQCLSLNQRMTSGISEICSYHKGSFPPPTKNKHAVRVRCMNKLLGLSNSPQVNRPIVTACVSVLTHSKYMRKSHWLQMQEKATALTTFNTTMSFKRWHCLLSRLSQYAVTYDLCMVLNPECLSESCPTDLPEARP